MVFFEKVTKTTSNTNHNHTKSMLKLLRSKAEIIFRLYAFHIMVMTKIGTKTIMLHLNEMRH